MYLPWSRLHPLNPCRSSPATASSPAHYTSNSHNSNTYLLRSDSSDSSDNEVYLQGTAHISESSANEVQQLVDVIKPHRIFIELDQSRAARLRASANESHDNAEDYIERMIREALRNYGRGGMPLPTLPGMPGGGGDRPDMLKAAFQLFYNVLKQYGYVPGIEMLAAMDEADRTGADILPQPLEEIGPARDEPNFKNQYKIEIVSQKYHSAGSMTTIVRSNGGMRAFCKNRRDGWLGGHRRDGCTRYVRK